MTTETQCSICGTSGHLIHTDLTDRLSNTPGTWELLQCDNNACGLIWISSLPSAETLRQAYSNYYTHAELTKPNRFRQIYNRCRIGYLVSRFGYPDTLANPLEKIIGWLIAVLPHRRAALDASILWLPWIANGKVLEIGCGNGDRLALLQELGWRILGIEPDPSSAAIARTRGLEIVNQPFRAGLTNAASIDAILLCHVIEHLPQPEDILTECHRLLKPGGILILLTPNTESLGHKEFGRDWLHLDPPRHLNLFNRNNLSRLLEKSGFTNPACSTSLRDANWTLAGSRALKKRNAYQIGKLSVIERLIGLCMLYREWLALKTSLSSGEDLLCFATKRPP